jgi:hypothetical protein
VTSPLVLPVPGGSVAGSVRALVEAFARGDPTGMKAAWAMLMNGAPPAATAARKPTSLNANERETTAASWDMAATAVS